MLAARSVITPPIGERLGWWQDDGQKAKEAWPFYIRTILTMVLRALVRLISFPAIVPSLIAQSVITRGFEAGPSWAYSNEVVAIGEAIPVEPSISFICLAQALSALAITFNPNYPFWLGVFLPEFVIVSITLRSLYYLVGTNLPTTLRRYHDSPYKAFALTAVFDGIALVVAFLALGRWVGTTGLSWHEVILVIKRMFGTESIKTLYSGHNAPAASVLYELPGYLWVIAVLKLGIKPSNFRHTDEDRRAASDILLGQGHFKQAAAKRSLIDVGNRSIMDIHLQGVCLIGIGEPEEGVRLLNKAKAVHGEEWDDNELYKYLQNLVTGSPLTSNAQMKLAVYVAKKYGDIYGLLLIDRAALGIKMIRQDIELLLDQPENENQPLTVAYAYFLIGDLPQVRRLCAYQPSSQIEQWVKNLLLMISSPNSTPEYHANIVAVFEEAKSFELNELSIANCFIGVVCLTLRQSGFSSASVLGELQQEYKSRLSESPEFKAAADVVEKEVHILDDHLTRNRRFNRIDDKVTKQTDAFLSFAKSSLRKIVHAPLALRKYFISGLDKCKHVLASAFNCACARMAKLWNMLISLLKRK